MLGLKVFSFAFRTQEQDYLEHKSVASKMDLADFIPGAFDTEPAGEVPADTYVGSSSDSMEGNPIIVIGEDTHAHPAPMEHDEEEDRESDGEGDDEVVSPQRHITTQGSAPLATVAVHSLMTTPAGRRLNEDPLESETPTSRPAAELTEDDLAEMLESYRRKRAGKQKLSYSAYRSQDVIPLSDEDEEEDLFQLKRLRSEGGTSGYNTPVDLNITVKPEKLDTVNDYNAKQSEERTRQMLEEIERKRDEDMEAMREQLRKEKEADIARMKEELKRELMQSQRPDPPMSFDMQSLFSQFMAYQQTMQGGPQPAPVPFAAPVFRPPGLNTPLASPTPLSPTPEPSEQPSPMMVDPINVGVLPVSPPTSLVVEDTVMHGADDIVQIPEIMKNSEISVPETPLEKEVGEEEGSGSKPMAMTPEEYVNLQKLHPEPSPAQLRAVEEAAEVAINEVTLP